MMRNASLVVVVVVVVSAFSYPVKSMTGRRACMGGTSPYATLAF